MNDIQVELSERLLALASANLKLANRLMRTAAGRYVGDQLMRSSASSGANYEEACGAESRADFAHKLQIVLKELRETCYWLKLVQGAGLASQEAVATLLNEADQLTRMIGKSVATVKLGSRPDGSTEPI